MKYRDVTRRHLVLGCIEILRTGGGSHRKYSKPSMGDLTVVPDWGDADLKHGTIRAAVRQLGLS